MARKKRQEEHVNHDRWLVSYADFITLLFAFFVVLYAISSVNDGKYRVLSDTLGAAFGPAGALTGSNENNRLHKSSPLNSEDIIDTEKLNRTMQAIDNMADELDEALSPEIQSELVNVKRKELWLEIEIKSSLLFHSGSASLSGKAVSVLGEIAKILKPFPNKIHVEGFTDNVPINNPVYPSNWELSAARAAIVVRILASYGIKPGNMAAIGYGEFHPIADNNTKAGRMKNRRVVLIVMAAGNHKAANPDQEMRGQGTPLPDSALQQLPLRTEP